MVEYLCGRVGCGEPATCVLLMAPQDTQAWLVDPDTPFAPDGVPLCSSHADRISVPFGWSLQDDRPAAKPKRKRRRKPAAAAQPEPAPEKATSPGATPDKATTPAPSTPEATPDKATTPAPSTPEAAPERSGRGAGSKPSTTTAQRGGDAKQTSPAAADVVPLSAPQESREPLVADEASPAEPVVAEDASGAAPESVGEASGAAPVSVGEAAGSPAAPAGGADAVDDPTLQLPRITRNHPSSPAEVPMNADATAAAVDESDRRLSVVPGDDDPNKTFDFEDDGQGALWADRAEDERDPDESTPLLKRAFRVVRDD